MKHTSRGFTVIEIIIVITLLAASSLIFFSQLQSIESAARDEQRKTAINAIYYSLEEVYFAENETYPRTISAEVLPSVDPGLFKDPQGVTLGDGTSDYRYEATDCNSAGCAAYSLRTTLENEDDFVKTNR